MGAVHKGREGPRWTVVLSEKKEKKKTKYIIRKVEAVTHTHTHTRAHAHAQTITYIAVI
jgi:hypothetical protein